MPSMRFRRVTMSAVSARAAVLFGRAIGAAAMCSAGAFAQSEKLPPIHPLSPVEHASKELLGAVSQVRALPGGRLLVNDNAGRKLVLYDAALAQFSVVADTTSATANAYSSRAAGLIAYKGDSSFFVDPSSLSMLVLDGAGKVTRVISVPRPNEAQALIGGPNGTPGFDGKGRLVYRAPPQLAMRAPAANGAFSMPVFPDSQAIVRIELASRVVDTVGFVKVPKVLMSMTQDANGRMSISSTTNPMPVTDDWAVLSDGSVALVRGIDYHVDWVRPGGERQSTGKTPFAWRHLDDSAKVAFLDSTKTALEKLREQANARMAAGGVNGPIMMGGAGDAVTAGGGGMVEFRVRAGGDEGARKAAPPAGGDGRGGAPGAQTFTLPPIQLVAASELPDYAPPFTQGAARGDMDGNLWVRTSNVVNGGSVYDVINSQGALVDRILVPAGRVIAGFGTGGVVYMGVREAAGVRLEQARRNLMANASK